MVKRLLVNRVGTKALVFVTWLPYTVPLRTWYCKIAVRRPGFAVKPARVALSTFAKAAFEGARMVMFWALPRVPTRSGLRARIPLN